MTQLIGFLAILILLSGELALSGPNCKTIDDEVAPCLPYLRGAKEPSKACCNGVNSLSEAAKTPPDRKAICECVKQGLAYVPDYDPGRVPLIPEQCHVNITLPPIDQNTDCSIAMEPLVA